MKIRFTNYIEIKIKKIPAETGILSLNVAINPIL